jgi:hypothetical protein
MSELLDKKFKFARLLPRLVDYIFTSGYSCTFGDVLRPWTGNKEFDLILPTLCTSCGQKVEPLRRKIFYGSEVSLHRLGLAVDLNLFAKVDGIWTYLTKTEDHRPFGAYWKSLDQDCQWGGEGSRHDGNHYSIGYKGRW